MTRTLRGVIAAVALTALVGGSAQGAALTKEPFTIDDAQDLLDLCGADPSDPLYDDAINFCHGYGMGAWQFHLAQANGPNGHKLVCLPDPSPTRTEALTMFVSWARAHPQFMSEPAVEALFRFLTEKWPCAEPAAKKGAAQ